MKILRMLRVFWRYLIEIAPDLGDIFDWLSSDQCVARSRYKGKTHNDMLRAIMRARLPTTAPGWAELSTELQDLISVMLQGNPKLRATMKEVLAHPWVQAGAEGAAVRERQAGGSGNSGSAPPVGIGISEAEVRLKHCRP